ncbi:NADPH:quinone reductase [Pseudanabaena sp. FACHB-2040]|uniref:NADPH:quinone reductase n=1 Tax=Pseudanabaena sp. FACHB-2040 TaxID=2692859 RepID=UPI00168602F1|nr:NADPH:quinone reductase [Pseudanabaena sp. FACHB-2040]MBD2259963.1 NADPH:quinone reductase [Pseudanabaena sp. FACHB-2040]
MKAIRVHQFGGPEVMELEDVPTPKLEAGQVLVRVEAAGVNPVDTYIRAGSYARRPELPFTPGIDGAGTVAGVGTGVSGIEVGARVYGGWPSSGTYAEMAIYPAEQIYPLPPQISFQQGAGIFVPYSTAHRALFSKGQAQSGETVLVHGATGSVGLAATQLAVAAGMRVLGTGGTPEGRSLVLDQGASQVFDHHSPDYPAEILAATAGRGVDVILEMLANVNLEQDLNLVASYGRIVVIGSRGSLEINPRAVMSKESIVTGLTLFNTRPEDLTQIQKALQIGLQDGTLRPVINREFSLAEANQAHRWLLQPGAQGNLVLIL